MRTPYHQTTVKYPYDELSKLAKTKALRMLQLRFFLVATYDKKHLFGVWLDDYCGIALCHDEYFGQECRRPFAHE